MFARFRHDIHIGHAIYPIPSERMDYTYSADEAIRMPLAVQSRNIIFHNGTVATATLGGEHIEVIIAAIGFAVPFMETIFTELLTALCAEEVFHVPCFLQCGNAFLKKNNLLLNQNRHLVSFECPVCLHPRWVHCNMRNEVKTDYDNQVRNKDVHRARRSS